MKTGDMVLQSEIVARWADGKRLAFIGDGDAISVCVGYLLRKEILDYGPSLITVFDFDERVVSAVKRFADKERLENLDACLYNCLDPFPQVAAFDFFYTNPPWGASNEGNSVNVFVQRGMEATGYVGEGMIVIADDEGLEWTRHVLRNVQRFANESGFFVARMQSKLHGYHLDDAPELKSCNIVIRALSATGGSVKSEPITDAERLANFYGRDNAPKVRYVRERKRLDYGKAHEDEYTLEFLEGTDGIDPKTR
jgi:predicted methyltransferase